MSNETKASSSLATQGIKSPGQIKRRRPRSKKPVDVNIDASIQDTQTVTEQATGNPILENVEATADVIVRKAAEVGAQRTAEGFEKVVVPALTQTAEAMSGNVLAMFAEHFGGEFGAQDGETFETQESLEDGSAA